MYFLVWTKFTGCARQADIHPPPRCRHRPLFLPKVKLPHTKNYFCEASDVCKASQPLDVFFPVTPLWWRPHPGDPQILYIPCFPLLCSPLGVGMVLILCSDQMGMGCSVICPRGFVCPLVEKGWPRFRTVRKMTERSLIGIFFWCPILVAESKSVHEFYRDRNIDIKSSSSNEVQMKILDPRLYIPPYLHWHILPHRCLPTHPTCLPIHLSIWLCVAPPQYPSGSFGYAPVPLPAPGLRR